MPKITLTSPNNQAPGCKFAGAGIPYMEVGPSYEITQDQARAIRTQYLTFSDAAKRSLRFVIVEAPKPVAAAVVSVADPAGAGQTGTTDGEPPSEPDNSGDLPPVEEITVLTEEDLSLIEIEIAKLSDTTIEKGTPLIQNIAASPGLPELVKVAYLEQVISKEGLQKGLVEVAEAALELLRPATV